MPRELLHDAQLLDPEADSPYRGSLLLEGGRILARLRPDDAVPDDARVTEMKGMHVAPGFVDLHTHGSVIFHHADGFHDALLSDSASYVRHGTTAYLATTVSWSMTRLTAFVTQFASNVSSGSWPGAKPIGIHLEGPWINLGAAGAQPGDGIRPYHPLEGAELLDRGEGAIRMVTLAPEIDGAPLLLAELAQRGIAAALGHSLANAEEAAGAADRGARHVTHLFNAMGELHHRSPGLAAAALSDDRLSCDLICDGAHVHPLMVAVAARAKGDGLMLITDRVDPPEASAVPASFGSGGIFGDGSAWRLEDGRLAGSDLGLDAALRNLVAFTGTSVLEAVAACTLRPARVLGIEAERGSLRPGARADLVVLDDALRVLETRIEGRCCYSARASSASS